MDKPSRTSTSGMTSRPSSRYIGSPQSSPTKSLSYIKEESGKAFARITSKASSIIPSTGSISGSREGKAEKTKEVETIFELPPILQAHENKPDVKLLFSKLCKAASSVMRPFDTEPSKVLEMTRFVLPEKEEKPVFQRSFLFTSLLLDLYNIVRSPDENIDEQEAFIGWCDEVVCYIVEQILLEAEQYGCSRANFLQFFCSTQYRGAIMHFIGEELYQLAKDKSGPSDATGFENILRGKQGTWKFFAEEYLLSGLDKTLKSNANKHYRLIAQACCAIKESDKAKIDVLLPQSKTLIFKNWQVVKVLERLVLAVCAGGTYHFKDLSEISDDTLYQYVRYIHKYEIQNIRETFAKHRLLTTQEIAYVERAADAFVAKAFFHIIGNNREAISNHMAQIATTGPDVLVKIAQPFVAELKEKGIANGNKVLTSRREDCVTNEVTEAWDLLKIIAGHQLSGDDLKVFCAHFCHLLSDEQLVAFFTATPLVSCNRNSSIERDRNRINRLVGIQVKKRRLQAASSHFQQALSDNTENVSELEEAAESDSLIFPSVDQPATDQ